MAGRLSRRRFLGLGVGAGAALALSHAGCRATRPGIAPPVEPGVLVNDVHSRLNTTLMRRCVRPTSVDEIAALVRCAGADGDSISVAGGRHAAGGQQFLADGVLLDMRGTNRVLSLDRERGVVEAEAGILWPDLMDGLARLQAGTPRSWGIVQKQGIDRMTLGGSLGSNMHGNALTEPPFVAQVESFTLVDARGDVRVCSRTENAERFALAIGGYGLFGVVASIRLRLAPRRRLRLAVQVADVGDVLPTLARRRAEGCLFGDWHYCADAASEGFLRRGVLATYRPLEETDATPATVEAEPTSREWLDLVLLGHTDPSAAFALYSESQLRRDGVVVWSDDFQLDRLYVDGYHAEVDRTLGARVPATESLVELFVPQESLAPFLGAVREFFLRRGVAPIYGTVRLAERDSETFLPWARVPRACLVLNLHVVHDDAGVRALGETFRGLVDVAAGYRGTFYLTYHRFATAAQLARCHPRLREFLGEKRRLDPCGVFDSDWLRHLAATLG